MELLRRLDRQYLGSYSIGALDRNVGRCLGRVTRKGGTCQLVQGLFLDAVGTAFTCAMVWQYEPYDAERAGGVVTSMEEQRAVAPAMDTIRPVARD